MTTALQPTSSNGGAVTANASGTAQPEDDQPSSGGSWSARHPAWPITALLVGWPGWWVLGVSDYAMVIMAVPCLMTMYQWRAKGTRRLRVPPGFGIWAIFLLISILGVFALSLTAPETAVSSTANRLVSWTIRTVSYLGCTVYLIYAGNLTERELPRKRLAFQLGLVGIYTVAGGIAGTFLPNIRLTSPLAALIPASVTAGNNELTLMLHPSLSEIQNFLGYAEGRPTAPFSYTNMWGNSLAILLPWLLVAWWSYGNRKQRQLALVVFGIALIPIVYSLDRGLWVGIGISIVYLAVRFAARGKLLFLGALCGALALVAVVVVFSPLGNLISQRLDHGQSNAGRSSHSLLALQIADSSPIIGYGDTRHEQGSAQSIAVGRTSTCHDCGQAVIGGDGQFQLMLICSGLLGPALYIAFFLYAAWRYRRDPTPYGMAGVLVLLVGLWFMCVYEQVGPPLVFTFLAYALLWRNERVWRSERELAASAEPGGPEVAADARQRPYPARIAR